jgi:uncharacterized Zn finger protein
MSTNSATAASSPPLPLVVVPAPAPEPAAVPPKRTSVADRVARAFPPLACVRGYRYFARRRVALANVSETGLDADVRGQRVQHVRLRVHSDGRLASGCTCAAKILGPAACRHVWATLLEIDRQGAFDGLRGTQRALALTALDAPVKRSKTAKTSETVSTAGAPKAKTKKAAKR